MNPADVVERQAAMWAQLEAQEPHRSLTAYVDEAIDRFADRPLWVQLDEATRPLTYGQLGVWSRRCAAALKDLGVGPGTHVAVMLPNDPAFAITWLAIARLGAVLLPVNTHYTAPELAYILDQGDAELLVIDREFVDVFQQVGTANLRLDRDRVVVHGGSTSGFTLDWHRLLEDAVPEAAASATVDMDDVLSIQFTSGSTGFPKGCLLSHRYWVTIGRVRAAHGVPVRRMLADMPFHYMGGQWRFLAAMLLGATLFVARRPSLARFLDRLLEHDLEFCSVGNATAKLPDDPGYGRSSLRWAASVGLQKELHEPLERRLRSPVRELYGTTETGSTTHMPVAAAHMVGSGSCGLPVAFRRCRIVGPDGNAVATGEAGELEVAGTGILLGYYKRPEADAAALRGGWFRTGDLVRQDREGYYYIVGRIKDVIRRSNENISAAEIEAVLHAMPEVLEAAAVPVRDPIRGEEVKVYISLAPGATPAEVPPERILEHCRGRLARFKLPRYVEYLDRLPHTASDKIAKPELIRARADHREGSFDLVDGVWRGEVHPPAEHGRGPRT